MIAAAADPGPGADPAAAPRPQPIKPPPIKPPPIHLDSDATPREAFAIIVRACLRQYRLNQDLLRADIAAEPVHQARVALRRLRSALTIHAALIGDDAEARHLRADLKWLTSAYAPVRDLDVLIPHSAGPARRDLMAERRRAAADLRLTLASNRARRLTVAVARWLAVGAWRTADRKPARRALRRFAAKILTDRWRRMKRHARHLAGRSDARRHRLRIDVKTMRYAIDFYASLFDRPAAARAVARMLAALTRLQDKLGQLSDLATGTALAGRTTAARGHDKRALIDAAGRAYADLVKLDRFWKG